MVASSVRVTIASTPSMQGITFNQIGLQKTTLEPWLLPDFTPLVIDDFEGHGKPNLPLRFNLHDPFTLFS